MDYRGQRVVTCCLLLGLLALSDAILVPAHQTISSKRAVLFSGITAPALREAV